MIEIIIPGAPIPWKRARTNRNRFYDSQAKEKERIRTFVKTLGIPFLIKQEALKVILEYNITPPASWTKNRALKTIGLPHIKRPDLDNYVKFTSDALNGIIWEDDSQLSTIWASKRYSSIPNTRILIEKLK